MTYRTRTYIAGDWTGDSAAIERLYKWNKEKFWSLSFTDAHEITQAKDTSLNCSIKNSLKARMDVSKTFVLIVGNHTDTVSAGSCQFCGSYNSWNYSCARGHYVDYKSYIKYECEKAVEAGIKIIVLYNAAVVNRNKCPEIIRYKGTHVPMMYVGFDGKKYWDYNAVKKAFDS